MLDRRDSRAMSKKAVARMLSALSGFRTLGSFYIGTCNQEVLSGYALDAPPGGIYIWRFILPAYDRLKFPHMSLGKRIAQFPLDKVSSESAGLELLLKNDWNEFSNVHDCQSLMTYLDREQVQGDYCEWTRYITYVRIGDLESARRVESQWQSSSGSPRIQLVAQNLELVLKVKERSGWSGVQGLLIEWSEQNISKFCE